MSETDRVRVVGAGEAYVGRQGFTFQTGVCAETVGPTRICMTLLPMPHGAQARAHYHQGIDTIAYLLEGRCTVYYGDSLQHVVSVEAGQQIFIPADVVHAPANTSGAQCTCLVVHSSGHDQDGIVLLPELDELLAERLHQTA